MAQVAGTAAWRMAAPTALIGVRRPTTGVRCAVVAIVPRLLLAYDSLAAAMVGSVVMWPMLRRYAI